MGRQVVLAIDDSSVSKDTVKWALKNALIQQDDEVTLLSVLEPAERPDFVAAGESSYPVEEYHKCQPNPLQLERTRHLLQDVKKEIETRGVQDVKMTTLVSCVGGSADTGRHICDFTASKQADLLVLGSRGMGSTKKAMLGLLGLGSVSDYVVKHACAPGVVVHKINSPAA